MKYILKNKNKIIIILLVLLVVLVGMLLVKYKIEKINQEKIELGSTFYKKIHDLYYYGGDIQYKVDQNNQRKYIEIENQKYYELSNYKEVFENLMVPSLLNHTNNFLNVELVEDKAYMKDFGRGISGYYGTNLKIKKIKKNKIEYIAYSKFCEIEYQVNYGDGCASDGYYEIEKPFVLVKENGIWKVEEYTSVFEFKDSEIK